MNKTVRAVALLVVLVAAACRSDAAVPTEPPTPTPSPSIAVVATASPTASPTRSPSAVPTTAPQTTARPVSRVAGDRLLPFYFEIRQLFPVLPPSVDILPDEPRGTEANAAFHGLNANGEPRFAVREDFVMDRGTAAHEIGHAYQKIVERLGPPGRDVLALYWSFRGFSGTWQQALAQSESEPTYSAKWITNPIESWAEAFRAAVTLEVKERTLDYGKTIDPLATREFFRSLVPAPPGQ